MTTPEVLLYSVKTCLVAAGRLWSISASAVPNGSRRPCALSVVLGRPPQRCANVLVCYYLNLTFTLFSLRAI